ncbi:hypothetical protein CHKEEEPN_4243 [Methylorubrum podarium]|nr:hypothetical protein CHKEEEPN_4243 [Methylorubrum podarium]
MLDRLEALADRELDVLGGDVVLVIDEGADLGRVRVGGHDPHRLEAGRRHGGLEVPPLVGPRRGGAGGEAVREAGGEIVAAARRAGRALRLGRRAGHEGIDPRVVGQLAARLREQVDGGRPAAGHADAVAGKKATAAAPAVAPDRRHDETRDALSALRSDHGVAGQHFGAGGAQLRQFRPAIRFQAQVDEGDVETGGARVERGLVGGGAARGEDELAARRHAVAVEEDPHALGEHDAGPVVVGEDEGALVGAAGEHHLARPHLPQALAGRLARGRRQVVGDPLGHRDVVVVVVAEGRGAGEQDHVLAAVEFGQRLGEPVRRRASVDLRRRVVQERAAGLRALVGEDDPLAGARRGEGGGETRRAGADDEHVAMGVAVGVAVGIGLGRRLAEAGGGADERLVDSVPELPGPHEGLVVEARHEDRRQKVVDRADIEVEGRPVVLRGRAQAGACLDHGGAVVRVDPAGPAIDREQRARLVGAVAQDAAGAVILERASDEVDAVGEQRRGDGVAGESVDRLAVEFEDDGAGAVDASAAGQSERLCHLTPSSRSGLRNWFRESSRASRRISESGLSRALAPNRRPLRRSALVPPSDRSR